MNNCPYDCRGCLCLTSKPPCTHCTDHWVEDDLFEKPTIEQVAWVFRHLYNQTLEGGSFRYLIYDRMGFGPEAYESLYKAGGMVLTNILYTEYERSKESEEENGTIN